MSEFKVCIEETVSDVFEIEAESPEEALEIAEEMYHNQEIILEPGELQSKQMAVVSEGYETEFVEF